MHTIRLLASLLALLGAMGAAAAETGNDAGLSRAVDAARGYRHEHGPRILRDYVELLEVPNVPGDPA